GHETGNALLRHAAGALGRVLRDGDIFARFMGDEFAIILPNISGLDVVERVAAKLLAAAGLPCEIDGAEIVTTASIGASIYPRDNGSAYDLLVAADAAMTCAQAMGGNRMRCYAPEMKEHGHSVFSLEADLRRAIEEGELRVHYQPRALLSDGGIAGAEALVRWQHPVRGMVSPADFIPLAEMSGLIVPLGAWVLREVCRQLRAWLDAGLAPLVVAVNLSPRQFREPELVRDVRAALNEFGLAPSALGLEITESTVIDNIDDAVIKLNALKAIGIVLSLDDFGTGHSSLSRLRELPIDHLKIDQSFVRNMTTVPDDAAICRSIIDLAHNLRLTVIAEGVETAGQANLLRQYRCDEIQGYYFSRPMPAAEMTAMLATGARIDLPELCEDQCRTLLIVDDEPNILGALQRMLRREGYRILAAGSGEQALDILACHRVQVILSDQRMPGMCGADFLGRAFELYPDTVRMMLSGYTDLQTVTDSVNRGAIFKFIAKPWDDGQLRADIREAFLRTEAMTLPAPG
ncbi:MAG TPA: EAL domain-containing protein, partial [Telluria sp.]|nr:EAL domain-containing protein [Telluria sp.]